MGNKRWSVYALRAPFAEIGERFGIDQVTARIIRNRGINGDEAIRKYLHGSWEDLYDPYLLGGTPEAAALIREKIKAGRKIRIIGDYDADGVCATYILCTVLRAIGADADFAIPERLRDGYGIHDRQIEEAFQDGVDMIITCDNGITAMQPLRLAKKLGMSVIVTDHHLPDRDEHGNVLLPPADVIIDPHLPGDIYPFSEICGAVTAWKLMLVFAAETGSSMLSDLCRRLIEFAAFATVTDVMQLCDENRIIVRLGLEKMNRTSNTGLRALIRECGLTGKQILSYHIGFVLGPCINAGGRLETARLSLELFLEENEEKAAQLAKKLAALNEERKALTEQGVQNACELVSSLPENLRKVLVIYLPGCHESIAGIIAGKVREQFYRPSFILTDSQNSGILKGSGRSIEDYDMHDALLKVKDLFVDFGGHKSAAGLSIEKRKLSEMAARLNEQCPLTETQLTEKLMIDVPMPAHYVTPALVDEFRLLEPFGNGNPRPAFAQKAVRLRRAYWIGQNRIGIRFMFTDESGKYMEAVRFGDGQEILDYLSVKFGDAAVRKLFQGLEQTITMDILYHPQINEYNGERRIQFRIDDYR